MSRLLIQCTHLYKSSIFEDLSLSVNQGELFALIGENGVGKTTLLQLLAANFSPDSGEVCRQCSIGFLPQEITLTDPSILVREYLEGSFAQIEREMHACLEDTKRLAEWATLHETYEHLGGYRKVPIEGVINGLKLETNLLDLPMACLSSGQRMRAALAKALIENPDLLLLDEPTNHLDPEMLEWLEVTLKKREGACVVVSHDRKFLNSVCNRLIEIKDGKLTYFGGSYDFYLEEQKRAMERQLKAYEAQEEERALLKQKIKEMAFSQKRTTPKDHNFMAYDRRGETHQKSLQNKLRAMKTRLEEIESQPLLHPKAKSIKGINFSETPLISDVAIELKHITKAYGDQILFTDMSNTLCKGDRILITGPNGCGKTTLLKIIAGLTKPETGEIRYSPTTKIAYLDQEVELLPLNQTPLHYFELPEEDLRRELHKAALGGEDLLYRPFCSMSTGQRKRLMLLTLILKKPNVLLLDEPTNHLDFLTLEALEKALLEFKGVVVAVSHDITFIKKIATDEWKI